MVGHLLSMLKVLGSIPFNHETKIKSIQVIVRVHH